MIYGSRGWYHNQNITRKYIQPSFGFAHFISLESSGPSAFLNFTFNNPPPLLFYALTAPEAPPAGAAASVDFLTTLRPATR